MQAIAANSLIFQPQQQTSFSIDYWDTAFATLEGNEASGGIVMDLRQPKGDGTYTLKAAVTAAAATTDATYGTAAMAAFVNAANSAAVVTNGRVANLIGYWAAGAPGEHGAGVRGKVAYHFRCYLRSINGRTWFSSAAQPTFSIAVAGNGYIRIDKRVGGTVTTLLNRAVLEADFLENGLTFTPSITNMSAGDYLDIFYVQDGELWGGFVVKSVSGSVQTQALAQSAPILGCGFMDDDTSRAGTLVKRTLTMIADVEVVQSLGQSAQLSFRLPLIKPSVYDGIGWEWVRTSSDDPGVLRAHDVTTFDLKRQRLVRIKGGFVGEQYTLFTGFIDDFDDPADGNVEVKCLGFEQRILDQFMKNYPDRVSYMAFGYKGRSGVAEPVYDVSAYDNWPLEYVLRDLLVRAGIDESKVTKNLTVPLSTGSTSGVTYGTDTYRKFRARAMSGKFLRLERPVHYGNTGAGFNESKPHDDEYIFTPENTKELWHRCRELADRYGYDFRFDEIGEAILQPRNNPHFVQDITGGAGSTKTNPSAFGGTYKEWTGTVTLFTTLVQGARIDISVPRGVGLGSWTYTVKRASDSVIVASGTINPDNTSTTATPEFFYDFRAAVDGSNSTVATLYTGDFANYNVELSSSGGAGGTLRRVDCFLLYHTDPADPMFPAPFSTDVNALKVGAQSTMNDMRNHVIVVGRRVAVVTDSIKFETNPENPDAEFVVERAVDVASVVDPTAKNYIGYTKESIIYDSSVADQDVAGYLARVFIYRQRNPKPIASITHTIVPVVQLRDPVFAVDAGFNTIDAQTVLYVVSIRHRFDMQGALTTIDTTSYPEFPAYEPREDIDIDANFGGNPVVNVSVGYTSVTGETQTNLPVGNGKVSPIYLSSDADISAPQTVVKTEATPPYLDLAASTFPWPPIPGTVQIRATGASSLLGGTPQVVSKAVTDVYPGGGFGIGSGSGRIRLPNLMSLNSVTVTGWGNYTDDSGNTQPTALSVVQPSATKGVQPWHYEYDELTQTIAVYYDTVVTQPITIYQWSLDINYTPYRDGISGSWLTNTPNHHFMNVDYQNAGRKVYLPWKEADGGTTYSGITLIPSFDVRYRRMGPVDGSGNFADPYSGRSPFYDPYSSELGYLISVGFDALVSGLYRISIRSLVDDTVVAWLTEPAANPDQVESHWQYISAGAGKRYAWDGIDQTGAWNRRQSEDYATGAMGAFEADERPVIGRGFYAWNEERRKGLLGPLALIAGTRDATTGIPSFGVGTFSSWYIKFEVKNDTLEAIAQNNQIAGGVRDPKKMLPRVVNSKELDPIYNSACIADSGTSSGSNTTTTFNATSETWIVDVWKGYRVKITGGTGSGQIRNILSNTATQLTILAIEPWSVTPDATSTFEIQSTAAVAYMHLSDPTRIELGVSDWKPTVAAFDETNQTAIDTTANWAADPDETGTSTGANTSTTLNDTGRTWTTNMWKGRDVKIISGTGIGQIRRIVSNTGTALTVVPAWTVTPGASPYRILAGAIINNQKAVRVRFTVLPRPGTLWTGKQTEVSIKLTRRVHLRASIFDQFAIYYGTNYPGQTTENRRIATRRLMNDSHTLDFADTGYRKASSFKQSDGGTGIEWLFLPRHFAKNFRGVEDEALQFGDYLQLEEVPTFNPNRPIAGERSRLALAFMNYLFYLSAFTQDRSGRFVWCLNRQFLDKTKIIKNAYADWWDPASPTTAATSSTYRNTWPESSLRQHRRSVIVRQWSDESGWQAAQRTKWGFSVGGTGDKLLRHLWKDHDVENNTLLVDATWPVLDTDEHSKWHRDGRTALPATFFNMTRQLGASGTTRLNLWTWEGLTDNTQWVPCVTRDFHGYYFVPPMVDKENNEGSNKSNIYRSVDANGFQGGSNQGDDVAGAEVWNSPVWDMTQAYDSSSSGKKRFWPGMVVDPGKGPTANPLPTNAFDYQRQDELVHYEDLRGIFSRGKRPQEQPKKVSPVLPYYVNPFAYDTMTEVQAYKNPLYPKFKAKVTNWFDMKFRHQYLWESAEMFPTDAAGRELVGMVNYDILRLSQPADAAREVRFDGGAWTGWKDDIATTSEADVNYKLWTNLVNVFQVGSSLPPTMPIAIGPRLDVTVDMIFHMVLINERRNAPLSV